MFALRVHKALQFCGTEHLIDTESDINYLDVCLLSLVMRRRGRCLSHVPKLSSEDESGRALCGAISASANLASSIERRQGSITRQLPFSCTPLFETYYFTDVDEDEKDGEDVKITCLSAGKSDELFRSSQLAVSGRASKQIHLTSITVHRQTTLSVYISPGVRIDDDGGCLTRPGTIGGSIL